MYKSTQSPAWFKKSLLVTSLLAAIYQTTAGAADTTAHTTTSDTSSDSSEQMTVTAPAPLLKAGSEHSVSAQELQDKGAKDFGSVMRYEPLISATGAGCDRTRLRRPCRPEYVWHRSRLHRPVYVWQHRYSVRRHLD